MPAISFNQAFSEALLTPDVPVDTLLQDPVGNLSAQTRFNVYRNNVIVGLIDNLKAGYPVTMELVGEEFFMAMADNYCRNALPQNPVMTHFGEDFASFINDFPPARSVPYLGDVAQLEWARRRAYHATDAPVARLEDLRFFPESDYGSLIFEKHPAAMLIISDFPIHNIWLHNSQNTDAPPPERLEAQTVLVTRKQLVVHQQPIAENMALFLDQILKKIPFGEAAGIAQAENPDFDLAQGLVYLFSLDCIGGVGVKSDSQIA